jgi:DNA helicase-2/ATP-dependent DNA helicase PcrA
VPFAPPRNFKKVNTGIPASTTGEYSSVEEILIGSEVMHDKFGKGKVLALDGQAPDIKATIFFPKEGQKQLLLRFAKLKVIAG